MTTTWQASRPGRAPAAPGVIGIGAAPEPYLWIQVVNEGIAGLPRDFGDLNPSALVTGQPSRIFEAVETVESFATSNAAAAFFMTFLPHGSPQAMVDGRPQTVSVTSEPVTLGDQAFATRLSLPAAGIPTTIQFVVRQAATVLTLQLDGGQGITTSGELTKAEAAITQLDAACGRTG